MTSQEFNTYLPVYDYMPEKWEQARQQLTEYLRRISDNVNSKESGAYTGDETITGYQFFPTSTDNQAFREVFRLVVDFGALPNATTKSVPHNLTLDSDYTFIRMFGCGTDPTTFNAVSIPNEDIQLNIDATNINITTTTDYSSYTRCYIVLEYTRET